MNRSKERRLVVMIIGKKLKLRAPMKEDIERWLVWMNDPEATCGLCNRAIYGYTREQEEEFYDNANKTRDVIFSIDDLGGQHIGTIGLHRINWEWRNAELGILIGEKDHWGRGYGTEATALMVKFAFERMNLHRITLLVAENNTGGIKCYEKVGFQKEGVLRQNRYYDGKYINDKVMGIIKGELKFELNDDPF